jgi:preprotein translocase subunit YajC
MTNLAFFLQGATSIIGSPFIMLLLMFGVFYFILFRPQQKRQAALREMISQLKAGDKIITTGGIIATVTAVREKTLLVRSADKSILEITRASVAAMHGEEEKGS